MDHMFEHTPSLSEDNSIPLLRERVESARAREDYPGLSYALGALGRALLKEHSTLEGLTCFDEAVKIAQQLDDPEAEARHLGNQGIALAHIGNFSQAHRSFRKAYTIAQRIGHTPLIFDALVQIADLEMERENPEGALASLEDALQIAEQKGNLPPQLKAHLMLGRIYWTQQEFDLAAGHYQSALHLATTLEDGGAQVECLHQLGAMAKSRGETAQAVSYFRQALDVPLELKHPQRDLALVAQLGDALLDSGDFSQALDNYEKALQLARTLSDRQAEARLLGSLSIVQAELGDREQSITLTDRAVEMARESGQIQLLGEQLLLQALAYYDHGQMQAALSACIEALAIFEKIEASSLLEKAMDLLEEIQSGH